MLPAEYDITDKVVFITGAGRGISKGIAQVLAYEPVMSYSAEPLRITLARRAPVWGPLLRGIDPS